jgi:hypothetical protein
MAANVSSYTPLFARSANGIITVVDIGETPGDVFFVDSNHAAASDASASGGRRPDAPFATLAYAFSSDAVTSGDVVYVMPSHAETINAAGDITMDIAGVKVIGLGDGATRPTFTFATDTAATWLITAASITVENILITTTGAVDFVNGITVTAADCTLVDVEIRESGATSQFVDPLIISTGAARTKLVRYVCRSHASGDAIQSGVLIDAAVDGVEIDDCWIDGLFATGNIESTAAALNTIIRRPILRQRHATQAAAINLHASNTGAVVSPMARVTLATAAGFNGAYVGAAAQFYDPLASNAAGDAAENPLFATGRRVSKTTGTLAATTVALFTIAGGRVGINVIYGIVGTAITVANSYKLVSNPTTGTTMDLCTATDLGTNDTPAGAVLSMTAPSAVITGGSTSTVSTMSLQGMVIIPVGQIESVSAGTDGEITWVVYWVPLDAGATLVAA